LQSSLCELSGSESEFAGHSESSPPEQNALAGHDSHGPPGGPWNPGLQMAGVVVGGSVVEEDEVVGPGVVLDEVDACNVEDEVVGCGVVVVEEEDAVVVSLGVLLGGILQFDPLHPSKHLQIPVSPRQRPLALQVIGAKQVKIHDGVYVSSVHKQRPP